MPTYSRYLLSYNTPPLGHFLASHVSSMLFAIFSFVFAIQRLLSSAPSRAQETYQLPSPEIGWWLARPSTVSSAPPYSQSKELREACIVWPPLHGVKEKMRNTNVWTNRRCDFAMDILTQAITNFKISYIRRTLFALLLLVG